MSSSTALLDLLREFGDVPAPSGHEAMLAAVVAERWGRSGTVRRDGLGNLSVTLGDGEPHVAFVAHLDEVGFIVRRVREDGFLRLQRMGGIPERVLPGQELLVLGRNGPVSGVVGTWPHHYTPAEDKLRVTPIDGLYLDIGATSADDAAARGIRVGDVGVYARRFWTSGDTVFSNSLDDRAGLAVLTESLAQITPPDEGRVSFIASVQEEFSIRGLVPTVRRLAPDALIVVDVSPATDTPEMGEAASEVVLGGGPVGHLYSFHGRGTLAGVIPPPGLVDHVELVAGKQGLQLQRALFHGGLTDGSFAQLEAGGVPSIELGVAVRGTHGPVERCSAGDLTELKTLVTGLAMEPLPALHPPFPEVAS